MKSETDGRKWRYYFCFAVCLLALCGLSARLVTLVLFGGARAAQAARQQRMSLRVPARPGGIFARAGSSFVPLAISTESPYCFVDPSLLGDGEIYPVSFCVSQILGVEPWLIEEIITSRRSKRFVYLARDISPEQVNAVRELSLRAVGIGYEWKREYPNSELASTVVGFRLRAGSGGGGLELSQDAILSAHDGKGVVLTDGARRPIWPVPQESRPARDGQGVFLFLDSVIQGQLQEAVAESVEKFSAKWGTGVVVDPNTGAILAMSSAPGFDPAQFATATPASMTNRAVSVPFEPGSVAKPIFAAAAVDAGLLDYESIIFCENGVYNASRGGRISDHGKKYGDLTLADIIVYSSNIGMAKVGEILGNPAIHEVARRFGFGSKTGIELTGESGGIVRPLKKWDGYSMRRVPFGQEISATALQLAMAFSAIANGGEMLRPRLIDKVTDSDGTIVFESQKQVIRRVLSPVTAAQTRRVLGEVVNRGTGRMCKLDGWSSFGKTGTAQIPGPGGYAENAYTGTFVGGAPVEKPALICVISIYWPVSSKGYYGSVVAAPYVKRVLAESLKYLDVPPDKESSSLAVRD